jgi:hypothetical protein
MKRQLTLIVLSLFLLAGCQRGELLPTEIKVEAESIGGTRARFTLAPANSRAYYSYAIVSRDNENYDAPATSICYDEIQWMESLLLDWGHGSFTDYFCYQGNRQLTLKTLASDKDFKFIVFQINPKNHEIIGEPVVCEFHTKPVPRRDLHFQVNFVADELHITPSNDSLTYFWDYDETEMISSTYDSTPTYYLYTLAGMYQEYGFMEFYYYDGPCVWYLSLEDDMTDGTEYTLVIAGCEEGELTTAATVVRFIYHPDNIEMLSIEEVDDLGLWRRRNNSRQMESRTTATPSSRLSLPGKARAGLARNGKAHD